MLLLVSINSVSFTIEVHGEISSCFVLLMINKQTDQLLIWKAKIQLYRSLKHQWLTSCGWAAEIRCT